MVTKFGLPSRLQPRGIGACRTHAERERRPPLLERLMDDIDLNRPCLDLIQLDRVEQLGEVTLAGARESRLVVGFAIQRADGIPECGEWATATGMVPDARRYRSARFGDPPHLA